MNIERKNYKINNRILESVLMQNNFLWFVMKIKIVELEIWHAKRYLRGGISDFVALFVLYWNARDLAWNFKKLKI